MAELTEISLFGLKIGARSKVKVLDLIESVERFHKNYTRNLEQLEGEEGVPTGLIRELRRVEKEIDKIVKKLEKLKRKYKIH